MNMSQHRNFSWMIAVIVLGYSVVLPAGWAQTHGKKAVPSEPLLNVSSEDTESPERIVEPNFALIEQVQATDLGQHVQVRVVGSGALSCSPFHLAYPDRLVLDCAGAQVRAKSTPNYVKLDPVLSVRVGQFKTNVARVVIELAGKTPYVVRAEGHMVLVTFDLIHRQEPSSETKSKQIDANASPINEEANQIASGRVPTTPDKLPVAERAAVTSAGFARPEELPQYPPAQKPVPAQPVPETASEPVRLPKTVTEPGALAEKLDSILPDQDYVIGPQDLLAINVWHEPELSQSVPVRPDGKISLPLIGEIGRA